MPKISSPQSVWAVNGNFVTLPPAPLFETTDPTALLVANPGQTLVQTADQTYWVYTGTQWLQLETGGGAGIFANLTVNPGPTDLTGALTVTSGANDTNIAADNANGDINIGTQGNRDLIIGSIAAGASTILRSGTGGTIVASTGVTQVTTTRANADALLVNATDALGGITLSAAGNTVNTALSAAGETHTLTNLPFTVATGSGTINIGNDGGILTANFGTGGTNTKTVRVGSTAVASTTTVQGGTVGVTVTAAATGTVDISADTAANTVRLGTGAAVKAVTIGSTTTTSSTIIQGGATGSIQLNGSGLVSMAPGNVATVGGNPAATLDTNVGRLTFTGFTTAAAASQVFTITNAKVIANSGILVTVQNNGAADAQLTIARVNPAVGSFAVTVRNDGAAALDVGSNVIITFWVIS